MRVTAMGSVLLILLFLHWLFATQHERNPFPDFRLNPQMHLDLVNAERESGSVVRLLPTRIPDLTSVLS